ncbi:MAG: ABC-F family ATP-binding cassette domain-containing protein [Elusimicrobiaceae bacterium]|nr:ABC-F family ATP-binding cassette domain-containing protein [Elusimicrobiaceae bacterium]
MIDISALSYHIGKRSIFEDASCFIDKGHKVGLVGLNGCGKTTLFKLILGQLYPDGGQINISKDIRIASVEQDIKDINQTILNHVLNSDKQMKALYDELEKNPTGVRLAEIYDKLDTLGAHSAPARASAILGGLGFSEQDLNRPLKEFSGGWRMRAALAAALFMPSDCLLLDEPTNHLDLETSIWLEDALEKLDKTLIIISHDRNILNKICDKIILVDECKLKVFNGNYDSYERQRHEQTEQIIKDAKKYEETRRHLQSFVDRFRAKATKAKQAQSRLKMLERLGDAPKIPIERSVRFTFPEAQILDSYLFTLENVSCGYGDKIVLKDINLSISQDDKIALLGANGNGKSTFAKLLSGQIASQSGKMTYARKLKIAYFAQHQTELLDIEKTPYELAREKMLEAKEAQVYTHLASFGLEKSKADTLIEKLSGGEKSRLLLSLITIDNPHILILDEPTNHLDIVSRRALIEALNNYNGAVILVTHDFHIIEAVCDRLLLVENHQISSYDGDMEDYKNYILRNWGKASSKEKAQGGAQAQKRRAAAQLRAQAAPIKKEMKILEKKLENLTKQKEMLEKSLIQNYDSQLSIELAFLNKEISETENKWLDLSSMLEPLL